MTKQEIERLAICYQKAYYSPLAPTSKEYDIFDIEESFCAGAETILGKLWKDAQGDDLPVYDREVIVLQNCAGHWKVFFGHRPNPNGWVTVDGEKLYAKTYDKGGWNWPDIALWLDVELPKDLED